LIKYIINSDWPPQVAQSSG